MAKDLATRVRDTATQQAAQAGGNGDERPTLRQLIERMKPEIGKALPKHMDPDRIARIAITLVGSNAQLASCTPESFLGALMTASQLGLEPGPLGEAYLVPFGDKVTFIAGYRGLIKLAYQSGQLKRINAHVVRENDDFDFGYGLDPYLTHKPVLGDRGKPIAVYAAAKLDNDECPFVVMSIDEVERIRARSRAAQKGPWVTDWDAMARKTGVRQLARWLPMSTDKAGFNTAVALDGTERSDIAGAVDDQIPYIDAPAEPPRLIAGGGRGGGPSPDYTCPCGAKGEHYEDDCPNGGIDGTNEPPPPLAPPPAPTQMADIDTVADDQVAADQAHAAAEDEQKPADAARAPTDLVAKLRRQLTDMKITNPAEQLFILGQVAGRKLPTTNDITTVEAQRAAELFVRAGHADEPGRALDQLLAELEDQRGGGGGA